MGFVGKFNKKGLCPKLDFVKEIASVVSFLCGDFAYIFFYDRIEKSFIVR